MGELLDKLILFFMLCFAAAPASLFPLVPGGSIGGFMPFLLNTISRKILLLQFHRLSSRRLPAAGIFSSFIPFSLIMTYGGPASAPFTCFFRQPYFFQLGRVSPLAMAVFFLYTGLSALLKLRTLALSRSRRDYKDLTDNAKEISLHLEQKNKELLEKQDYEIQVATLNERNRIGPGNPRQRGTSSFPLHFAAWSAQGGPPSGAGAERPAGHLEIHLIPGHGQYTGKRPRPA